MVYQVKSSFLVFQRSLRYEESPKVNLTVLGDRENLSLLTFRSKDASGMSSFSGFRFTQLSRSIFRTISAKQIMVGLSEIGRGGVVDIDQGYPV